MKVFSKLKKDLIFDCDEVISHNLIEEIEVNLNNELINIFQTSDWISSSLKSSKKRKFCLIKGYFKGKLCYFLPLECFFRKTDIFYTYINPTFSDYSQPYFSKEIHPKNLKEYNGLIQESIKTFKKPAIIFLRNQKDIYNFLPKQKNFNTYTYTNSYYINSNNLKLNKSFQKKLNYYKKRISKEFPEHIFSDKCKLINNIMPQLKEIDEIISLKNKQYIKTNSKKQIDSKLWENINLNHSSKTAIYISTLKIKSKIISGVISLIHNKNIYYMIPAYDYNYKKYSLGLLHLNYLINFVKINGIDGIDLTIGDEKYKTKFCTEKSIIFSSFFTNKFFMKPIIFFMMFSYKIINFKNLKFIFNNLKNL